MTRLILLLGLAATVLALFASAASAKTGSRSDPYALGATAKIQLDDDPWTLRVLGVNTNAWPVIHKTNEFNDAPKKGTVFYMVKIQLHYEGNGSTTVDDGSLEAVGKSSVAYTNFNPGCGVLPNAVQDFEGSVFHGGAVTGNICFEVKTSDVASLELFVVPFLSGSQIFFKL